MLVFQHDSDTFAESGYLRHDVSHTSSETASLLQDVGDTPSESLDSLHEGEHSRASTLVVRRL